MQNILISVIIPLYNKESRIFDTIQSVLNQSYCQLELIVVDDGSTDRSAEVVKSVFDRRLRLIQKPNGGPSSARNRGVREAKGEWVYFIDADDLMESNTLSHFVGLVEKNPDINVFVSNFYYRKGSLFKKQSIYMKDGILDNNFRSWFFGTLRPCQGAVLYRKVLLENHPFPEYLRRWEDAAMFFEIMRTEKIYTSKTPIFTYNLDAAAASHGRTDIKEDFVGYLNPDGKPFWERMSMQILYKQAVSLYPEQSRDLYGEQLFGLSDRIWYGVLDAFIFVQRAYAKIVNMVFGAR